MGRLKQVKPQLGTLRPAINMLAPRAAGGSWQRENPEERQFYKTARWQRLRMAVLTRDLFICQWPGCGRLVADTSKLVADHIVPVRVDPELKWDAVNLRCLCKDCHDGPRQVQELAMYGPSGRMGRGG